MKPQVIHPDEYITDSKGKIKSVVVDAKKFDALIDLLEDFGLGLSMKRAMKDKKYSREEALKILGEK
jgi:hypothetical protein